MLLTITVSRLSPHTLRAALQLEGAKPALVDLPEALWADPFGQAAPELERYGTGLFAALFQSGTPGGLLWAGAVKHLHRLRMAVDDPFSSIAWELLRDPRSAHPLACQVAAMVRGAPGEVPAPPARPAPAAPQKARILLVVPRIRGEAGERFQSSALRMLNGLCPACREYFQLDWLANPSRAGLEEKLRQAQADGQPYHILHYEGHAAYDLEETSAEGPGYLVLEEAGQPAPLAGLALGDLLRQTGVAILALHAAHSGSGARDAARGFQAVAARVFGAGVPAALLIPTLLDSDSAARACGDLYAALAQGESLGAAVAAERRYLFGRAAQIPDPLAWSVPLVFERAPLRIVEPLPIENPPILRISIQSRGQERVPEEMDPALAAQLGQRGAEGLDGWLLLLDQAFENHPVLLFHGPDAPGLAAIAAEYARWQGNLGALGRQPVVYTSLRDCFAFSDLLDSFGRVYEQALLDLGVTWQALDEREREKLVQDLVRKVPILWVWDQLAATRRTPLGWDGAEWEKAASFLKAFPRGLGKLLLLSTAPEAALEQLTLSVAYPRPAPRGLVAPDPLLEWGRGLDPDGPEVHSEAGLIDLARASAFGLLNSPDGKVTSLRLFGAENGLRAALELALSGGDAPAVAELLPALRLALLARRKYLPFSRLLERCAPLFIAASPSGGSPRKGRSAGALLLMQYSVEVGQLRGRPSEARPWQALRVAYLQSCLRRSPQAEQAALSAEMEAALTLLADLHLAAGSPAAIPALIKVYHLASARGDLPRAAAHALRAASATVQLPAARNLTRARRWVGIARKLLDPQDASGQAQCFLVDSTIAFERFLEAQKAVASAPRLLEQLNEALACAYDALDAAGDSAPHAAAQAQEMLGYLYLQSEGMTVEAIARYDQAIALFEASADLPAAQRARFNLAVALFLLAQFEPARAYTLAALRGFEALGPAYSQDVQKARRLLARFP